MAGPRYERVREAFRACFEEHGEVGAAVCVYLDGHPVVDLWGGLADASTQRAWERDTPVLVFSASKGATAVVVNRLVERGELDLDAPVARYWPEFAQAGKGKIPLRWVLSHRAGVAAIDAELDNEEIFAWDPVVEAIAAQEAQWEPGSAHGYHARTYGWILGEVVRRVAGESLGRVFAREVAGPLGLDFWIGLPVEVEPRVAPLIPPQQPTDPAERELRARFMGPDTLLGRVLGGPGDLAYGEVWNSRALHAAELPSSNGIGTARALARMYAALLGPVDGVRLLRPETVDAARTVQSEGPDRVIHVPTRFGLGFMLPPTLAPGCGAESFGHPGAGGSLAFADPGRGLAFAYVMNQMRLGLTGDERSQGLVAALYEAVDGA